jgi:hypothetical protein
VRKLLWIFLGLWLCGLPLSAATETWTLGDGATLTGEIIRITDSGLYIRLEDNTYTNVLWTRFSQDGLKQLSVNPKIKPLVEPFIEMPASRPRAAEVQVQAVTNRLALPSNPSVIGGLFTSSVGLFLLFLFYAANLYAAFEVAVCKGRPIPLVMGVAAVAPMVGPIVFLSLPVPVQPVEAGATEQAAEEASFTVPGQEPAKPPAEIHITAASWQPGGGKSPPQIFQRGQFTFNRRFFETRFPGFFGSLRREEDRDKELHLKATRGEFNVERITSVAADEIHFEMLQGGAKQSVALPFADIQEIKVITKDA